MGGNRPPACSQPAHGSQSSTRGGLERTRRCRCDMRVSRGAIRHHSAAIPAPCPPHYFSDAGTESVTTTRAVHPATSVRNRAAGLASRGVGPSPGDVPPRYARVASVSSSQGIPKWEESCRLRAAEDDASGHRGAADGRRRPWLLGHARPAAGRPGRRSARRSRAGRPTPTTTTARGRTSRPCTPPSAARCAACWRSTGSASGRVVPVCSAGRRRRPARRCCDAGSARRRPDAALREPVEPTTGPSSSAGCRESASAARRTPPTTRRADLPAVVEPAQLRRTPARPRCSDAGWSAADRAAALAPGCARRRGPWTEPCGANRSSRRYGVSSIAPAAGRRGTSR